MTDLASAQWLAALDDRLRSITIDPQRSEAHPIVVEFHLDDETSTTWSLVIESGRARVVPGTAAEPTLRIATDRATLGALAGGSLNAQRAVDAGALRLRGDLNRLAAAGPVLAAIGEHLRANDPIADRADRGRHDG